MINSLGKGTAIGIKSVCPARHDFWLSFREDYNTFLQKVQHLVYGEMLFRLFTVCRARYLAAATLLRTEDRLSALLRPMDTFDHRTLQNAHDRIAAAFRFRFVDSFQLLLGEKDEDYRHRLEREWRNYFIEQARSLASDDEFTRAVCTAAAMATCAHGINAENWLQQFLEDRYPLG